MNIASLVDTERHPLHLPHGGVKAQLLARTRDALDRDGCAVLPGFLRLDMVAAPERCMQLYGKVLPVHLERAGQRADRLMD